MESKIIGILLFICACINVQAQIKVQATGAWFISNISPEEARAHALAEAKKDALRKAGIEEAVTSMETMISLKSGQDYFEYNELDLRGGISDFVLLEDSTILEGNLLKKIIVIEASVVKYKNARDAHFVFAVKKIKHHYQEEDSLVFEVEPSADGFLKVFFFEEDGQGDLLFPSSIEPDNFLKSNFKYCFPQNKRMQYTLTKNNYRKLSERNTLIFVYTKTNVPFKEENISYETVSNWIAKINPDSRYERFYGFSIYKK